MFATGETLGLAEWIIDGTSLVFFVSYYVKYNCFLKCFVIRNVHF